MKVMAVDNVGATTGQVTTVAAGTSVVLNQPTFDWNTIIAIIIMLAGFGVTTFYAWRQDKRKQEYQKRKELREVEEHEARMKKLND